MAAKRGKASTEEEAALKEKYRLLKKVQAVRAAPISPEIVSQCPCRRAPSAQWMHA